MRAKRYSKEEWEAAKSLKKCGKTWEEVAGALGRKGNNIGKVIKKCGGDYEEYIAQWRNRKMPTRKTEQLQFLPPEVPKAPRKIQIKSMSEREWNERKLAMASKQARIVARFVAEMKDAGFRFE